MQTANHQSMVTYGVQYYTSISTTSTKASLKAATHRLRFSRPCRGGGSRNPNCSAVCQLLWSCVALRKKGGQPSSSRVTEQRQGDTYSCIFRALIGQRRKGKAAAQALCSPQAAGWWQGGHCVVFGVYRCLARPLNSAQTFAPPAVRLPSQRKSTVPSNKTAVYLIS